jgi:hypothetical protein
LAAQRKFVMQFVDLCACPHPHGHFFRPVLDNPDGRFDKAGAGMERAAQVPSGAGSLDRYCAGRPDILGELSQPVVVGERCHLNTAVISTPLSSQSYP